MILSTGCILLLLTAQAVTGNAEGHRPAPGVPSPVARIDALHRRRDQKSAFDEERRLLESALANAPGDYALLWRSARADFWLGDDPSLAREERSRWGKAGWDLAERAIAASGGQPDGYYWAAVNMGSYALGLGVVKSLTMGLEGKFKDRLTRAGQLAPAYEFGGIDVAWGRFYEKLPWPKRDRKEAEKHLRHVLEALKPGNLRARVFLAEVLTEEHRAEEAKKLLDEVAAARIGAYDPPEERRAKGLGESLRSDIAKAKP